MCGRVLGIFTLREGWEWKIYHLCFEGIKIHHDQHLTIILVKTDKFCDPGQQAKEENCGNPANPIQAENPSHSIFVEKPSSLVSAKEKLVDRKREGRRSHREAGMGDVRRNTSVLGRLRRGLRRDRRDTIHTERRSSSGDINPRMVDAPTRGEPMNPEGRGSVARAGCGDAHQHGASHPTRPPPPPSRLLRAAEAAEQPLRPGKGYSHLPLFTAHPTPCKIASSKGGG